MIIDPCLRKIEKQELDIQPKRTMVSFPLTELLIIRYDCSVVNFYEVNIMSDETSPTTDQVESLMARVFALVRACPVGRVTTYGWLARTIGYPRGARMVGWFMNVTPEGVPAQRVINSKGELSGSWAFGQQGRMRSLLEAEGIVFSQEGRVDLKRYGWDPSRDLSEEELRDILEKAGNSHYEVNEQLLGLARNDPASPLRGQPSS